MHVRIAALPPLLRHLRLCTSFQEEWRDLRCVGRQEWITPEPSRRPDIFPEFEKLKTPMPKPMPGDPEKPDEVLHSP